MAAACHVEKSAGTIAVVGYSLRGPNCSSVPEFAAALQEGKDLTTASTRYPSGHMGLPPRQGLIKDKDIASFDPSFFRMSHKQAEAMDPLIRMLLQVSYEALMDAQVDIEGARGSRTGVYAGHCFSDTLSRLTSAPNKNKNGYELINGASSMAANRLSYFYDFRGPSMAIDTACSSSLVALHSAVQDLQRGVIDRALVAGLSLTLDPHRNSSFNEFRMLSPSGRCFVFDSRANGYCRSDGVNCIVLERRQASRDPTVYACIAGTGTNSDGFKMEGITYPSADQQANLFNSVFQTSSVAPEDISYHEAHGTGTIAGDKAELQGLVKVYEHPIVVGSVKSNMGHAEGASGLFGLIKILIMFEEKTLFPNHDFQESPHAMIQDGRIRVLRHSQQWHPTPCSISSFGFGGTNAFAILVPPLEAIPSSEKANVPHCLPFAASRDTPISENTQHPSFFGLQRMIGNHTPFPYKWKKGEWKTYSPLVFVCDGQGSQWIGMGKDLIPTSQPFRDTMQKLQDETGIPLVSLYEDGSKWMETIYSSIGIVSFQLGILAILRDAGIHPDLFLGHSLGELACSYLAGLATEAQVLGFARQRSKLAALLDPNFRLDVYAEEPTDRYDYVMDQQDSKATGLLFVKRVSVDTPYDNRVVDSFSMDGQMVVVGCSAEVASASISDLGLGQTRVAAFNAPGGQTVSGPKLEVQRLLEKLRQDSPTMFIRELDTGSIAYHSEMLKVFRQWLQMQFKDVESSKIPSSWRSTSRNTTFGVDYLVDNICRPVYFQEAIETLPQGATLVEIGPSSGLLSQIKRTRTDLVLVDIARQSEPMDVQGALNKLKAWQQTDHRSSVAIKPYTRRRLPLNERYPPLWSAIRRFAVPKWQDFELPQTSERPKVVYDLTKKPWSTIRDHVIRGQNLFPATGFLHAAWWAVSFEAGYEILDFSVHTPLVIAPSAKQVMLVLHKAGPCCELWDEPGEIRYASARIQRVSNMTQRPTAMPKVSSGHCLVEGSHYYADIRRRGYEYGLSYQLLKEVAIDRSCLQDALTDWISYMDAMLQADVLSWGNSFALGYPVGIERVIFWSNTLSEAPRWVFKPRALCWGNCSVQMEGIRWEYIPVVEKQHSIHREVFVEYSDTQTNPSIENISEAIRRNTQNFHVIEPLKSGMLRLVVNELAACPAAFRSTDPSAVAVLSDHSQIELSTGALLLTSDKQPPRSSAVLVAVWGELYLYKVGAAAEELPLVDHWKNAAMLTKPFVWKGSGTSGAVASLCAETRGMTKAISCEGGLGVKPDHGVLKKAMHHNFVLGDGRHGIWVDEVISEQTLSSGGQSASTVLKISRPGSLESLIWCAIDPNKHSVKTKVAALNFRDVMRAMGKLKEKDLSLGLEFSGIDKETNQRVFGVAKSTLGTDCSPLYSYPTPTHFSDEEAATIPIVYLTVYYALFKKANMKPGESVLIHAGTGGVGMAAITIAQKRGLKVFTTCSEPKRDFLKTKFGLTDDQIGDSRSDAFVDTVLQGTDGRGVDVVLNQLAGPLQVAGLRCVAEGGQFCEIGKYDILQNTKLSQALLASNISFHAIDLLPLLSDPSYKPVWNEILSRSFAQNEIVPLPTTIFDAENIVEAFRFMSQGKHKGKILVNGLNRSYTVSSAISSNQEKVHLITGGLGGLGLSLAYRLAQQQGCGKLVLVGRSGVKNGWQQQKIQEIEALGCEVQVLQIDLLKLKPSMTDSPDRIWHVATVYNDRFLADMTQEAWDSVVDTKVQGYYTLRNGWPEIPIVAFSSVSAYFGNAMQTSYALANACLDAAARKDSNTLSIRLAPLDNVGFITKASNHRALFERFPFHVMPIDGVLSRILEITSVYPSGVFGIYDLKKEVELESGRKLSGSSSPNTPLDCHRRYTLEDAQSVSSRVLGGSPDQYKASTSLRSAGLDSLSTMEIVHHLNEQTGSHSFKPSDISDTFTVQDIVESVHRVQQGSQHINDDGDDDADGSNNKWDRHSKSKADCWEIPRVTAEGDLMMPLAAPPNAGSGGDRAKVPPSARSGGCAGTGNDYDRGMLCRNQRLEMATLLLVTTLFWIIGVSVGDHRAADIFHNGALVAALCCLVQVITTLVVKEYPTLRIRGSPTTLAHYLLGVVSFFAYTILYLWDAKNFVQYWSSVYWGYYLSDNIFLVVYWKSIHQSFRFFYSLHHAISFGFTGSFFLWGGLWEDYLNLALMLWMTAEIWYYSLNLYRHVELMLLAGRAGRLLHPLTTNQLTRWKIRCFWLERGHRLVTYLAALLWAGFDLSNFAYFVLIGGLVMDMNDAMFQWKSIQPMLQQAQQQGERRQPTVDHQARDAVEDEEIGLVGVVPVREPSNSHFDGLLQPAHTMDSKMSTGSVVGLVSHHRQGSVEAKAGDASQKGVFANGSSSLSVSFRM